MGDKTIEAKVTEKEKADEKINDGVAAGNLTAAVHDDRENVHLH